MGLGEISDRSGESDAEATQKKTADRFHDGGGNVGRGRSAAIKEGEENGS